MLARWLTTILPAMTLAEAIETTRIHRVAGLTGGRTALVTTRPCRARHHTISDVGRIGSGCIVVQGELALTHHGVLSPDERPACTRPGLEGRSSAVMFPLRLLRRQNQIAEQPSHQSCQHDRPRPQVHRPPPSVHEP
jgi:Magnesium chelatase, subunit ChlI